MSDVDPEPHRAQLAANARRKDCRTLGFPRRWNPGSVINPVSEMPYTDAGAWELIADLLEAGHPIETMTMDDPKGKTGFVMHYELTPGTVPLYIKLHFGAKGVIGRSFHISDF